MKLKDVETDRLVTELARRNFFDDEGNEYLYLLRDSSKREALLNMFRLRNVATNEEILKEVSNLLDNPRD